MAVAAHGHRWYWCLISGAVLALADMAGRCGLGTTQDLGLAAASLLPPSVSGKQGLVGIFVVAVFVSAFALLQLKNAETNLASCIYFYEVPVCPDCFANYLQLRGIFSCLIKGNNNKAT